MDRPSPPPTGQAPLRDLQPGQCLLLAAYNLMTVMDRLWLDALRVRLTSLRDDELQQLLASAPGSELWMTKVTLQGNGDGECDCGSCGVGTSGHACVCRRCGHCKPSRARYIGPMCGCHHLMHSSSSNLCRVRGTWQALWLAGCAWCGVGAHGDWWCACRLTFADFDGHHTFYARYDGRVSLVQCTFAGSNLVTRDRCD